MTPTVRWTRIRTASKTRTSSRRSLAPESLAISISADGSVILPSDVGDAVADDVAMEEE